MLEKNIYTNAEIDKLSQFFFKSTLRYENDRLNNEKYTR